MLLLWEEGVKMWILVLLLSVKLQMPTCYWIIFTIITILRPLIELFKNRFINEFFKKFGNE